MQEFTIPHLKLASEVKAMNIILVDVLIIEKVRCPFPGRSSVEWRKEPLHEHPIKGILRRMAEDGQWHQPCGNFAGQWLTEGDEGNGPG